MTYFFGIAQNRPLLIKYLFHRTDNNYYLIHMVKLGKQDEHFKKKFIINVHNLFLCI